MFHPIDNILSEQRGPLDELECYFFFISKKMEKVYITIRISQVTAT